MTVEGCQKSSANVVRYFDTTHKSRTPGKHSIRSIYIRIHVSDGVGLCSRKLKTAQKANGKMEKLVRKKFGGCPYFSSPSRPVLSQIVILMGNVNVHQALRKTYHTLVAGTWLARRDGPG